MNLIDSLIEEGWLKTPRIIEAFQKIKRQDFLPALPARFDKASARRAGRPGDVKDLAEANEAIPIGFGQTISQPLVVAFMLELLQPQSGEKILDIGSGSGWTTALLANIVGEKGRIYAIEIIPELKEFGEKNVAKYNFLAPHRPAESGTGAGIEKGIVKFISADGSKGYKKEAPFDKILASASAQKEIPVAWKEQLKIGGRIVTPIGDSIWLFIKKSEKPSTRAKPRTRAELGSGLSRTELRSSSGLGAGLVPHRPAESGTGAGDFEEQEFPGFVFVPLIEK